MLEVIRKVHTEGWSSAVRDCYGVPMYEDPDVRVDETLLYDLDTDKRYLRVEYDCDFLIDDSTHEISRKEAIRWAMDNGFRNLCTVGKRRLRQVGKWIKMRKMRNFVGKEDELCMMKHMISELNRLFTTEEEDYA